ncbi:hypothetical protein KQH61_04745 [bacterium]|nr:hypothetical protein [bacterium]MCB2179209.1 hypothetical protein [bacterium]
MENFQQKLLNAYQAAENGNFDHARMVLEETLYEFPDSIEAWLLLADLSDEADEARQCYQMVLEIDPNNWVAQQRMKLLFSSNNQSGVADFSSNTLLFPEDEAEPKDIFEELAEIEAEDEEEDETPKDGPTLKESFQAHKKLVLGAGGGVLLLFIFGVIAWVLSIGFIAWRMGYLILGG